MTKPGWLCNKRTASWLITGLVAGVGTAFSAVAGAVEASASDDPFAPLLIETRPLATRWLTDYQGSVELGLAYTSDNNFVFGEYNGLHDKGVTAIGNLRWQQWQGDQFWRVEGDDLGLKTRQGAVEWRDGNRFSLRFEVDNQLQVRNDGGQTPYTGTNVLSLPDDWQAGITTGDFTALDGALHPFSQDTERNEYALSFTAQLSHRWQMHSRVSVEDKTGTDTQGAAIYISGASADAVLLPQEVDQRTTDFDLGFDYQGDKLVLNSSYNFTVFDNSDSVLSWQNPYASNYDARVDYPNGYGGLGQAPDNQYQQLRLAGAYQFSPRMRISMDGSYGKVEQDENFASYSVNPSLLVYQPLPIDSLNGEVETSVLNVKLANRLSSKLSLDLSYHYEDRDNGSPRESYRYIRGDAEDQPASPYSVYNTAHDTRKQLAGFEFQYRLPWRSKMDLGYEYEEFKRQNAAVEKTEQDRYYTVLRSQPWANTTLRLEVSYADRTADTYEWGQSYYALLDTALINATPDSQRYISHPLLSQYYLSSREQWQTKLDLSYMPAVNWQIAFNGQWRNDDFDKTYLGLTEQQSQHYNLSGSYFPRDEVSLTAYTSFDMNKSWQVGRAFRGGVEKNAFEVVSPLPQASDPNRDWNVNARDEALALGINLRWQPQERVEIDADCSVVDTKGDETFTTYGGVGIETSPLPDITTREYRVALNGSYHLREDLSLRLEYRYFRYRQDNWAIDGLGPTTLDKVLALGEQSPQENVHYMGASVVYRWH